MIQKSSSPEPSPRGRRRNLTSNFTTWLKRCTKNGCPALLRKHVVIVGKQQRCEQIFFSLNHDVIAYWGHTFFMNIAWSIWNPSSNSKATLAGQIKDWLDCGGGPTGFKWLQASSLSSLSVPPPSTSVKSKSSISTRAMSISYYDPLTTSDFPCPDYCARGFGDDGVRDEDERMALILASLSSERRTVSWSQSESVSKPVWQRT